MQAELVQCSMKWVCECVCIYVREEIPLRASAYVTLEIYILSPYFTFLTSSIHTQHLWATALIYNVQQRPHHLYVSNTYFLHSTHLGQLIASGQTSSALRILFWATVKLLRRDSTFTVHSTTVHTCADKMRCPLWYNHRGSVIIYVGLPPVSWINEESFV